MNAVRQGLNELFVEAGRQADAFRRDGVSPLVPALILRSGTSRIVVLRGDDLPTANPATFEAVLASFVGGDTLEDGLGAEHYQLNKVAVCTQFLGPSRFAFRFYQYDRTSGRLLKGMACSNSAVGAGMYAVLRGLAGPDADGALHGLNEGTGQHIDLFPPETPRVGGWRVRYLIPDDSSVRLLSGPRMLRLSRPDGLPVLYQVVIRANVFVLAQAGPEEVSLELAARLAEVGEHVATAHGVDFAHAHAPKVLCFRPRTHDAGGADLAVRCFFNGQQHHSLPGSGAMSLAAFLALEHLHQHEVAGNGGTLLFNLAHPSGTMPVTVLWEKSAGGYRVQSTEVTNQARLLFAGCLTIPEQFHSALASERA